MRIRRHGACRAESPASSWAPSRGSDAPDMLLEWTHCSVVLEEAGGTRCGGAGILAGRAGAEGFAAQSHLHSFVVIFKNISFTICNMKNLSGGLMSISLLDVNTDVIIRFFCLASRRFP